LTHNGQIETDSAIAVRKEHRALLRNCASMVPVAAWFPHEDSDVLTALLGDEQFTMQMHVQLQQILPAVACLMTDLSMYVPSLSRQFGRSFLTSPACLISSSLSAAWRAVLRELGQRAKQTFASDPAWTDVALEEIPRLQNYEFFWVIVMARSESGFRKLIMDAARPRAKRGSFRR
jgi:hypothetical protein